MDRLKFLVSASAKTIHYPLSISMRHCSKIQAAPHQLSPHRNSELRDTLTFKKFNTFGRPFNT